MKRRGFTMLEMVVAMLVSTLLLGAIASVFVLQARAMPDTSSAAAQSGVASRAIARFAYDLSRAQFVAEASPGHCTLVVADCTGDGVSDLVVYTWAAGSSWQRSLNGGVAETLCTNVTNLTTTWRVRTVAAPSTVRTVEGVEIRMTLVDAKAAAIEASGRAVCHARLP